MPKFLEDISLLLDPDIKLSLSFAKTQDPKYIAAIVTLKAPEDFMAEGKEDLFAAMVHTQICVDKISCPINLRSDKVSMQTGYHFTSAAQCLEALESTGVVSIPEDKKQEARALQL